jgi:hypothetical protein
MGLFFAAFFTAFVALTHGIGPFEQWGITFWEVAAFYFMGGASCRVDSSAIASPDGHPSGKNVRRLCGHDSMHHHAIIAARSSAATGLGDRLEHLGLFSCDGRTIWRGNDGSSDEG